MRYTLNEYVVLALCAALFLGAAAFPTYIYLDTKEAERYVATVESQLGSARSREIQARLVKQLLADTQTEREALEGASLPRDGAAVLIDLLERDARAAGIAFDIGGVSIDPKEGPLDTLKVTMRGSGSFSSAMQLVALVGAVPYVSTVDAAVLERGEKGIWSATITLSVAIRKDL